VPTTFNNSVRPGARMQVLERPRGQTALEDPSTDGPAAVLAPKASSWLVLQSAHRGRARGALRVRGDRDRIDTDELKALLFKIYRLNCVRLAPQVRGWMSRSVLTLRRLHGADGAPSYRPGAENPGAVDQRAERPAGVGAA